jgi:phosphoserine aminotransferase
VRGGCSGRLEVGGIHRRFAGARRAVQSESLDDQNARVKSIVSNLEKERAAYDIGAYRDAPVGLRVWGGATVETSDIQALLPWLDWAYAAATPN